MKELNLSEVTFYILRKGIGKGIGKGNLVRKLRSPKLIKETTDKTQQEHNSDWLIISLTDSGN